MIGNLFNLIRELERNFYLGKRTTLAGLYFIIKFLHAHFSHLPSGSPIPMSSLNGDHTGSQSYVGFDKMGKCTKNAFAFTTVHFDSLLKILKNELNSSNEVLVIKLNSGFRTGVETLC